MKLCDRCLKKEKVKNTTSFIRDITFGITPEVSMSCQLCLTCRDSLREKFNNMIHEWKTLEVEIPEGMRHLIEKKENEK